MVMKGSEVRSVRVDSVGRLHNWTADSYNSVRLCFSLYILDDDSQPIFDKRNAWRICDFCKNAAWTLDAEFFKYQKFAISCKITTKKMKLAKMQLNAMNRIKHICWVVQSEVEIYKKQISKKSNLNCEKQLKEA